MSQPNSIFIATRKNAIAHASGDESQIKNLFEFGGITDLDVSNLYSIVANEPFDFDKHELEPLEEDTDGELFELPKRFLTALSKISEENIEHVAEKWAETEELECDPSDLVPIIAKFRSLSKDVEGERLYYTQ